MLRPGIRTKLSVFTILFAGMIIYVMSQLFIRQEKIVLTESFQKEIKPAANYIGSIVYDLERISQSLILIEDFRIRIKENKKVLAANRNVGSYKQDRTFLGFSLNKTFSKIGVNISQKTINYDNETFFSKYLSEKDIKELESNLKIQFRDMDGKVVSDKIFTDLQTLANRVILEEKSLEDTLDRKLNESYIEKNKNKIKLARNNLRQKILSILQEEQKQKIRELDLETSRIRIQSFTILPIGDSYAEFPGFDTSIFEPKANINSKELQDHLEPKLNSIISSLNKSENLNLESDQFILTNRNYETQFDFFYMNNDSVNRAKFLLAVNLDDPWKEYFEKEKQLQLEFKNLSIKIKERIETLKKEKLKVNASLSKDKEFSAHYKEYRKLLEKRSQLIEESSKKIAGFNELEKTRNDFSEEDSLQLKIKDAIVSIREVALYDYVVLKYKVNRNHYDEYLVNEKVRAMDLNSAKAIRNWVMDANEEGVPQNLKRIIENGMISHSRTEAEEYIWELDSTPIYDLSDKSLAKDFIQKNKIGLIRVLIDKQDGFDRIEREKNEILWIAYFIGTIAFIAALYLSGIMVRKIKRIISSADELGKGNLETKFQHGGGDEFGVLTTVLNKMTTDLKQRQEMLLEYAAAEDIQKGLLPTEMPFQDSLQFGNFYKSMSGVGGDYYDFIELDSERMVFCIGDVSNHGIGPALVMVALRSQLRGLVRHQATNLNEILLTLNEQVYGDTPSHIFVTFFVGLFYKKTGRITFYNCGHSKPLIYRARSKSLESPTSGGMPLGAIDNFIFETTIEESTVTLEKGDLFFQYTDGLNEAMNKDSELFGNERLEKILSDKGSDSPNEITEFIAKEVEKFSGKKIFCEGPSELNDDIAMIAFRFKG